MPKPTDKAEENAGDANRTAFDNSIGGLYLRVPSTELRDHLQARATYHRARADVKSKDLPQMREIAEKFNNAKAEAIEGSVGVMNKSNMCYHSDPNSNLKEWERDILNHRNRAVAFDWFADHLFEGDYCLERKDLVELEILKGWN